MATNPANAAAYQQVRPAQSGIAQDLQFWTQDARASRQEQRMDRQFQYDKQKDDYARKKEMYDKFLKPYSSTDTGSGSLNYVQSRALSIAAQERYKAIEEAKKYEPYAAEWTRLMTKAENLNNAPENIMQMMNAQMQRDQGYKAALAEGKVWRNEEYERAFQSDYSNAEVGFDDNGNVIVAWRDKGGDGILDLEDAASFKDAGGAWEFIPKFDLVGASDDIAKRYVAHKDETQEGLWTTETEKVDEAVLRRAVTDLFADEKKMQSALKQFGIEDTEDNRNAIIERFYEDTRAKTTSNFSKTRDNTAALGFARLAKEGTPTTPAQGAPSAPGTPGQDTWGNNWETIKDSGNSSLAVASPIEIGTLNVSGGEDLTGATIYAVTIDKNGDVIVDAAVQTSKEETITEGGANQRVRQSNRADAKPRTQTKKGPTSKRQDYKVTKEQGESLLATIAIQRGTTVEKLKQGINGKSGQGSVMTNSENQALPKENGL